MGRTHNNSLALKVKKNFDSSIMSDWNNGLCGCFSNCASSIITYIIPCVTYAQNAEKAGTCGFLPSLICFFVPVINLYIGAKTRSDTREKYEIAGSFIGDCCCFIICPCCTMVQNQSQLDGVSMGETMDRV